jgi:hypothetical protein
MHLEEGPQQRQSRVCKLYPHRGCARSCRKIMHVWCHDGMAKDKVITTKSHKQPCAKMFWNIHSFKYAYGILPIPVKRHN